MSAARWRRLWRVGAVAALLAGAVALTLQALRDNLMFFYTPAQVEAHGLAAGTHFRLGGKVEPGSLQQAPDSLAVRFVVAEGGRRLHVAYEGLLPDLFGEDKGVVASGRLGEDGVFRAYEILAKHDETYQPPAAQQAGAARPAWVGRAP